MKKTCLSCDTSHFDESYASPGHNGKNSCFFYPQAERANKKKLFCSAISGLCTGDQSTGPLLVHQGLAPTRSTRSINAPQQQTKTRCALPLQSCFSFLREKKYKLLQRNKLLMNPQVMYVLVIFMLHIVRIHCTESCTHQFIYFCKLCFCMIF